MKKAFLKRNRPCRSEDRQGRLFTSNPLSGQDGFFGVLIEEVQPGGIQGHLHVVAGAGLGAGVNPGDHVFFLAGSGKL